MWGRIKLMLWVFIGLLGGFAFVFLTRFYWADAANSPEGQSPPRKPIVTLAIVTLIIALLVMISTGRLNWLSAALTAAIPFLRRGFSLLRYAPLFSELLRKASGPSSKQTPSTAKASGLSIEQARAMLEVPIGAEKDQIVAAHRRLMAKNHPDRGGSNYIAAQLNEAKELLLKTLQSK